MKMRKEFTCPLEMVEHEEKVTMSKLMQKTGLSREFIHKNRIM